MLSSGTSTKSYYEVMNNALKRLGGDYTMLHYPFFKRKGESFVQSQINLTDYCLSKLSALNNKRILDIGCGNGVQALYIAKSYKPELLTGIDLNSTNIEIASTEKQKAGIHGVLFQVDDAQNLKSLEDESYDTVINIESAFHYPDKKAFLQEVFRVLKPGGEFLIADILTTIKSAPAQGVFWKKKMILHHWHLDHYLENLSKAGLQIRTASDITHSIIKGFRNYPHWLKSRRKSGFLNDLVFRIFYLINIHLNIFLLRNYRQYYVIAGYKSRRIPSKERF